MISNRGIVLLSSFILFILLISLPAFSLHPPAHREINEHIALNNTVGFSLDDYLKNNLGIINGVQETIKKGSNNKALWWWLAEGGEREDDGLKPLSLRAWNHYHDPLDPWASAGYYGQSSILWAQDPNQATGSIFTDGKSYSWQDVRKYYHIALTGRDFTGTVVAGSKTLRDEYFADTFRGVGQLMHLIQDAAVLLHCRHSGLSGIFLNAVIPVPAYAGINSGGNSRSI
jgi:hypothetical protein